MFYNKADKEAVLTAVAQNQNEGMLDYASLNLRDSGFKAYLNGLLIIYSIPVHVFVATVLRGSMPHSPPTPPSASSPVSTRARASKISRRRARESCVLQKPNALGPEGAMAFKKHIAAFLGVPCPELYPLP